MKCNMCKQDHDEQYIQTYEGYQIQGNKRTTIKRYICEDCYNDLLNDLKVDEDYEEYFEIDNIRYYI